MTTSSLPVGSHNYANHTAQPESDLERKMTGISGRKCLEQFERFNQPGSWAKTFGALLIGTGAWYSTRCRLIWKLRATKSSRFYFQLVPSAHRIEETGYGLLPTPMACEGHKNMSCSDQNYLSNHARSGLLPSPVASDATTGAIIGKNDTFRETKGLPRKVNQNGKDGSVGLGRLVQLLPTPTTGADHGTQYKQGGRSLKNFMDHNGLLPTHREAASRGNCSNNRGKGNLEDAIAGMLPTPTANCHKGGAVRTDPSRQSDTLAHHFATTTGQTSQLSPLFVCEMMSFPLDYLVLPFQNGETKA